MAPPSCARSRRISRRESRTRCSPTCCAPPQVVEFKPNDTLIAEGAEDDPVYLVRTGSVTVSRRIAGKDIVLAYLPAGNYVGEMAMLTKSKRSATVKAAVATEAIKIDSAAFRALLDRVPELRREVEERLEQRMMEQRRMEHGATEGGIIEFLIRQGLGEATDVLLIDEALCVRCDNCEKACAETHHGVSRLNREAGPTYDTLHVPTSCRHCEHPHCMKDCPADAIHRAPNGEVFIDDKCIGCGNCERNCPYGVIQMAAVPAAKPGLLSWLLFGRGQRSGRGQDARRPGPADREQARGQVRHVQGHRRRPGLRPGLPHGRRDPRQSRAVHLRHPERAVMRAHPAARRGAAARRWRTRRTGIRRS